MTRCSSLFTGWKVISSQQVCDRSQRKSILDLSQNCLWLNKVYFSLWSSFSVIVLVRMQNCCVIICGKVWFCDGCLLPWALGASLSLPHFFSSMQHRKEFGHRPLTRWRKHWLPFVVWGQLLRDTGRIFERFNFTKYCTYLIVGSDL